MTARIPLSAPDVGGEEIRRVTEVLRSGRLSRGPRLPEFERELARYVGARHGIGVSSGTAALHLSLRALDIGPGDEVLTTPLSFVASANAIEMSGARPVFVDVDRHTLEPSADDLRRAITPRTRALLPVHLFGRPAELDPVLELAGREGLAVIEDACEALGAERHGRRAGSLGDIAAFGFYPNKPLTTGEGGMIVTDREDLAATATSLRNQGREEGSDDWLDQTLAGYNYRLSELAAALGLAQLGRLDERLDRRRQIAAAYRSRLGDCAHLRIPEADPPGVRTGWFVYVVRLTERFRREDRNAVVAALARRGIACGRYFPPIPLQPHYRERYGYRPGAFPEAEFVADRSLALPFFTALTEAQIDEVAGSLREELG